MTVGAAEITAPGKYGACHVSRIIQERGLHETAYLHNISPDAENSFGILYFYSVSACSLLKEQIRKPGKLGKAEPLSPDPLVKPKL